MGQRLGSQFVMFLVRPHEIPGDTKFCINRLNSVDFFVQFHFEFGRPALLTYLPALLTYLPALRTYLIGRDAHQATEKKSCCAEEVI